MSNFKILVVEDDRPVASLITTTLKINSYSFISAYSGSEAISLCASHRPSLILLDLGLPDIDGIEVIHRVREWSSAVIIISARSEDADKISALDAGADDYITKPFSVDEMLARIRAAQRRMNYIESQSGDSPLFTNGPLTIDFSSNIVKVNDTEIHLTSLEYRLLCLLARNVGKVLTHSYIISHVWESGMASDIVSLRVYMNALRRKIRSASKEEELIRTHIGIGYQMIRR